VLQLRAPMPGKIVEISVSQGAVVQEGDTVVVLESMKMETPIDAPEMGTVTMIHVAEGDTVATRSPRVTCWSN
jgi:biotin carboxyl carrier protein